MKAAFAAAGLFVLAASASEGVDYVLEGPRKTPEQCNAAFKAADEALSPLKFDRTTNDYYNAWKKIDVKRTACLERAIK